MTNGLKGMMILLLIAVCAAATWVGSSLMAARRTEAEMKAQQVKLKIAEEKRRTAEADEKAKAAEAKKADAMRAQAEAEKEKAVAARQERVQAKEEAQARLAAAEAEKAAKKAGERAAEAEAKRLTAAKAEADARRREKEAENKKMEWSVRQAEETRRAAEAELARTLAAKATAEAALKKSENDRKTAELTAAAERDRKLRLYRRAETSRAEMLELKRAEQLLALEESGLLTGQSEEPAKPENAEEEKPAQTNQAVLVAWKPEPSSQESADGTMAAHQELIDQARQVCSLKYMETFGPLIAEADREGRTAEAQRLRRALLSLLGDPVNAYVPLIEEALRKGLRDRAVRLCAEMVALVPQWRRVSVMAELLKRHTPRYGELLAGLTTQADFVRAFRKLYDEARLASPDSDERERATAELCTVLARYVPDYATHPAWR